MKTPSPILGLVLLTSTCLPSPLCGGKVEAHANPQADFAGYKTFQWLAPRVLTRMGIDENHPAAPILKEVVGKQLSQKGLREVAEGGDLQILAAVITQTTPQLEAIIYSSVAVDYQGDFMAIGGPVATVGRYNKEGSLYINLLDTKTKKSAWFAVATESLPNKTLKPEEIRSKLEKAANNMFKKYPGKR